MTETVEDGVRILDFTDEEPTAAELAAIEASATQELAGLRELVAGGGAPFIKLTFHAGDDGTSNTEIMAVGVDQAAVPYVLAEIAALIEAQRL